MRPVGRGRGARAAGIAEGREQLVGDFLAPGPVFRVPLNRQREARGIAHRSRLHGAVFRRRLDLQARRKFADGLAMQRVHADFLAAENTVQDPAGDRAHRVGKLETHVVVGGFGRPVVDAVVPLLDLSLDGATEGDVEFLVAAADGEQRNARVHGRARQFQRRRVAVEVERFVNFQRLVAVVGRVNVGGREPVRSTPSKRVIISAMSTCAPMHGISTGVARDTVTRACTYWFGAACQRYPSSSLMSVETRTRGDAVMKPNFL